MDLALRKWPTAAPLLPPEWISDQFNLFVAAVREAESGRLDAARDILKTIRSDDLRAWYVTALCSGTARFHALGRPIPERPLSKRDGVRILTEIERQVFKRDDFHCRYCDKRIVPLVVLKSLERSVGHEVFRATGTDTTRHGITLVFRACADHVAPWTQGGSTSLENLVTACWPCNFAKSNYTLAQIGLDDPRDRPPIKDGWDGLVSSVAGLRQARKLIRNPLV